MDEADIGQAPAVGLGGRGGEAGVQDVEPDETAGRECGAHEVERVAGSAAYVGDVDARLEALDKAGRVMKSKKRCCKDRPRCKSCPGVCKRLDG